MDKFLEFIGSNAFKNMAGIGMNLWQGSQMGDMMKFQKGLAQQSMNMQQGAYDANMEDRKKAANLDWTAGYGENIWG